MIALQSSVGSCGNALFASSLRLLRNVVLVSPAENACATGNGTMATIPRNIMLRFFRRLSLPLKTLGAISSNEFLDDQHVAIVVAPLAQAKLVCSGNKQ
jgi:hypothetical protein